MTRGRVVKIKMAGAAAAPAKAPGPEKPAADDGGANKTRRPRAGP
jgi:hypothetical protein